MPEISRRCFVGAVAAAAALSALPKQVSSAPTSSSTNRRKLTRFSYEHVRLTSGPLKDQFEQTLKYFMALDEDRALKVYRQCAGQPAPGADMGGWYDPLAFAPGHSFGQWISALSRFYAGTGNADCKAKVERLVEGFGKTLDGEKSFYDGHRFRAYIYDKHVIGLVDAYRYAGIDRAKDILKRATDQAVQYLPEKALTRQEQAARQHKDITYTWDEPYTLPENLFIALEVLQDDRYLELAKKYLHDKPYFDPLSRNENVLPGLHAYSHVNCLSSAARAYLHLGDEKYLRAIQNAWTMLEETQWFATGGWGPNEAFVHPHTAERAESLTKTHNHFETPCGSYAQFKLAMYLTEITGSSHYPDGLERMLYNGILATKLMGKDGQTFYYSDYSANAQKKYHPDKWPCCSGTYPQVVADYLSSAYLHDKAGVYVNLYVPSELKWNDVTLVQETDYPDSPLARFTIRTSAPKQFSVSFRIPGFAKEGFSVLIEGKSPGGSINSGFFSIDRNWRDGDQIQVEIPLLERQEAIDDQSPNLVANLKGPLVLVQLADGSLLPFYKVKDQPYTMYVKRS